jgi:hypothetical protein
MSRAVLLSIGALMLLAAEPLAVATAAAHGGVLFGIAVGLPALGVALFLLRLRVTAQRRTRRRKPDGRVHRGATKETYDPWVGGGLG